MLQSRFRGKIVEGLGCLVTVFGLLVALDAHAQDTWTFVWVGATAEGWKVVRGTAVAKISGEEMHFDLTGDNAVKYLLDVQVKANGRVEAGFTASGNDYFGIAILDGNYIKTGINARCKVDALQLRNELNTVVIGKFGPQGCT
jgi:hypothetical protein